MNVYGIVVTTDCSQCKGRGKPPGKDIVVFGEVVHCFACQGSKTEQRAMPLQDFVKLVMKQEFDIAAEPGRKQAREATVEHIQHVVARYFGLNREELLAKSRSKTTVKARHLAMRFVKERLKLSYPEIGKAFGGRDHSTVMVALERLELRRRANGGEADELRLCINDIRDLLDPTFPPTA